MRQIRNAVQLSGLKPDVLTFAISESTCFSVARRTTFLTSAAVFRHHSTDPPASFPGVNRGQSARKLAGESERDRSFVVTIAA